MPNADNETYEDLQDMVLSVSEERYEELQKETKTDPELQAVLTMVTKGWPDTKQQLPVERRSYWTFRDDVATADGLLFKGTRLIVPRPLNLKYFVRSTRVTWE